MVKKNACRFYTFVWLSLLVMIFSRCEKNEDNLVKDFDGNAYHTVTIGTQVWMVENLKAVHYNDGTDIPNGCDSSDWVSLNSPAYCWYKNDIHYKSMYGALYNWFTVNTGKLCPPGWHVPTDSDWITLGNYLKANGYNYDGTTTVNGYGKALASDTGWYSIQSIDCAIGSDDYPDKRNSTGFSGLPGGIRNPEGQFHNQYLFGLWWSSSERESGYAFHRTLAFDHCGVVRSWSLKGNGYSVRCLKDN